MSLFFLVFVIPFMKVEPQNKFDLCESKTKPEGGNRKGEPCQIVKAGIAGYSVLNAVVLETIY
jgi:hypothetical protein